MAPGAITQLLQDHRDGDASAFGRLVPLVYDDLRRLAKVQLRRLRPGETLDTTALIHEAYLRLVDQQQSRWNHRSHFFAVAATAMRQILIDHARYLARDKRGGGAQVLPLEEAIAGSQDEALGLIELDLALKKLAADHPRQVQVVECRFFVGLTAGETAEALGVGLRTVERDWLKAKAWLRDELSGALEEPKKVES